MRALNVVFSRLVPVGLAFCLWATAPAASAQGPSSQGPAPVAVTTVEGIAEYRLANGLQVLLVPDDSKPTTTVNVTYRVGSRHENYGETGMAHLLEHLVFKGTPTTKNALGEFARRGLRANGSTWTDRTNYFASFAADDANLRWYLSWQADIMVNSFIARADLDTEMTVVRNEFESGENNPGRVLFQRLLGTMYDWHNYGKSTIGARSDIENVDITRLQAFYRKHYQPDNATLIVSGKFDTAQVLAWVQQSFGAIPKPTRTLEPTYTLDPAQDGERVVTVRRVGGAPLIYIGYHVPPGPHPDFAAAQLLAGVLGDTPGGRLHKRVVEKGQAAQAFSATLAWAEPSALLVGAALAPGQDVAAARAAMAAVLDGVAAEPVTAEELQRARQAWLNDWDNGFADPERIGVALSEAISQGDWRLYFLARDRVRQVSLDDVNRVARSFLKRDNRSVAVFEPVPAADRAPTPAKVDVAKLVDGYKGDPAAAVAEAFDPKPELLDARTVQGAVSGPARLRYALLPKGTRGRAVRLRLSLHHGTEKSLVGQRTVAELAGALYDKGGAGLTRQQIADRFDALQAQVSISGTGESIWVAATTRRDRLPAVIELIGRLLREPAFDSGPLEEARSQWLVGLEQAKQEPGDVVSKRIERHGSRWPAGDVRHVPSFDEEAAAVRAVTLDQIKAFHRRFVSAQRGEFAAVGDMDVAAVRAALAQAFGDWKQPAGGPEAQARVPRPLAPAAAARFVEATPDKANANLLARLVLPIDDRHPDHAALLLANHVFGRDTDSRLWTRIRETEGLSYDVGSWFDFPVQDAGTTWTINAIFAPQNQPRVEKALQEELARSLAEGFTAAELAQGRAGLLKRRALSRAQDGVLVERLAGNLYHDRRFAREQQVDDALARVTLEQMNAAWRRHIDPAKLVFAWGGDFRAKP
jgi:zinc protease